jgi:hypothetical protein
MARKKSKEPKFPQNQVWFALLATILALVVIVSMLNTRPQETPSPRISATFAGCELREARWDSESAGENTEVLIVVSSENCLGKVLEVTIRDEAGGVVDTLTETIGDNTMEMPWRTPPGESRLSFTARTG